MSAPPRCTPRRAACAHLAAALAAFVFGGAAVATLTPLTMRPDPLQRLQLLNGTELLVLPDPAHTHSFVPDADASCPSLMLLGLLCIGWALTVAANLGSLHAALAAAAVYA